MAIVSLLSEYAPSQSGRMCGVCMKRLLLYILIFITGCAASVAWISLGPRKSQSPVSVRIPAPLPTKLPEYRESPPDKAIRGQITELTGTALLFSRTGEIPYEASAGAVILQGDTLSASPSSAVSVHFSNYMKIRIGEKSKVSFSGLLPDALLLWMRQGTAVFSNTDSGQPLAVRILDGILTITSGSATVQMKADSSGAEVTISSGSATLTQVDAGNETRTVTIPRGSRAYLDDVRDRIILR